VGGGGGGGGGGGIEGKDELARKKAAEKEKERGNEMFKGRRFGDAIEYYDKALLLDPEQAPLFLLNRAVAYSERCAYVHVCEYVFMYVCSK